MAWEFFTKKGAAVDGLTTIAEVRPPGTVIMSASNVIPDGWLLCDGSQVSRITYSDLYDVLGFLYGVAPAGFFTLPNYEAKFPMGASVASPLGTVTSPSVTHTHIGQWHKHPMPTHTHTLGTHTHTTGTHIHSMWNHSHSAGTNLTIAAAPETEYVDDTPATSTASPPGHLHNTGYITGQTGLLWNVSNNPINTTTQNFTVTDTAGSPPGPFTTGIPIIADPDHETDEAQIYYSTPVNHEPPHKPLYFIIKT